jgi:diguanylate cyclase (GGDEF)-like protein
LTIAILGALAIVLGTTALILAIRLRKAGRQQSQLRRLVAKLQKSERMLKVQAYYDPLTGLANRALFEDRFGMALEQSKRSKKQFSVLMVDLNHFKGINDNYGHAAGDLVLITVARRLLDAVRASDTVARLGGDEFALIIESIQMREQVVALGQKLIEVLSEKVTLETGVIVGVGGSIGFAWYPEDGENMKEMLEVADQAMYYCKTTGMMPLF